MDVDTDYALGTHQYHCRCEVCKRITGGQVHWPVQVALQYDATLPEDGGEFITSPMLCTTLFFKGLREIWDVICEDAVWTDQLPDRRGRRCSPSIHIHVSVDNPYQGLAPLGDLRHVLYTFMPELFKLASTCGKVRGLEYRNPNYAAGHHSALNVITNREEDGIRFNLTTPAELLGEPFATNTRQQRNAVSSVRLEWRMFEAAYDNWDYTAGAVVLSCALTQMAANPDTLDIVQGAVGLLSKKPKLERVNAKELMAQFSKPRFRFMRELVLSAPVVTEDEYMYEILDRFLSKVKGG
jgi:hypothetical protein